MTVLARKSSIVIDKYGVDPLKDLTHFSIGEIENYTTYTISEDEEYNAPLLSYNAYGSTAFWWVLMNYNGMVSMFDIKTGTVIKIPFQAEVIAVLSDAQTYVDSSSTVVI